MSAAVTFRIFLLKQRGPRFAQAFSHPASPCSGWGVAVTGIGPDLYTAARNAALGLVQHLVEPGIPAIDAYRLCSAATAPKFSKSSRKPMGLSPCTSTSTFWGGGRKPARRPSNDVS